jgi:NAD kinase
LGARCVLFFWSCSIALIAPSDENSEKIGLVVTLGGDGTILHASSLFSVGAVPPVLSFSMGTLGFLLPFRELQVRSLALVLVELNVMQTLMTLRKHLRPSLKAKRQSLTVCVCLAPSMITSHKKLGQMTSVSVCFRPGHVRQQIFIISQHGR